MEWIKKSEKLPKEEGFYLLLHEGYYEFAFFNGEIFHDDYLIPVDCDYWMYLPKKPNE